MAEDSARGETGLTWAQERRSVSRMSAVEIVQRQLEAYNAHDLVAFAACYTDDVEMIRLPAKEPAIRNKEEMIEFYGANRFLAPGLRAEILNRMALGNKVIDHERIHGL